MNPGPGSFEGALRDLERDAEMALRSLAAAVNEVKRVKAAATVGHVRDLHQALDHASRLAERAAGSVNELRSGWCFDVAGWFSSGEYSRELLATATEAGVKAAESDDRILCYPAVVRVSAVDTSVLIDKVKQRRVRPAVVVRQLAALQQRPPKFRPEPFLASLAGGYDLVVARKGLRPGVVVRLTDVHSVLTLLPGAARDYTRQEFARDLYLLDLSGVVRCRDGRRMSLPASALTRGGGVLTTVTQSGETKVYAGIAFDGGPR